MSIHEAAYVTQGLDRFRRTRRIKYESPLRRRGEDGGQRKDNIHCIQLPRTGWGRRLRATATLVSLLTPSTGMCFIPKCEEGCTRAARTLLGQVLYLELTISMTTRIVTLSHQCDTGRTEFRRQVQYHEPLQISHQNSILPAQFHSHSWPHDQTTRNERSLGSPLLAILNCAKWERHWIRW